MPEDAKVSTDLDAMIEDAIVNPAKYGFEWRYGSLNRKDGNSKIQITDRAPYAFVTDLGLHRQFMGDGRITSAINETSFKVQDQELRAVLLDDLKLRHDDTGMKRWVLNNRFGRASRSKVVVIQEIYVANDGQQFPTAAEALAHNVDLQLAKQQA